MSSGEVAPERIRNFCIVAHIDHGKSTLADRMLEATHALSDREKKDQFLDNMELERERGITIKAQTVRMRFEAEDGEEYLLNLIDTPGHVDFSYEVSRALAACEGALLVVDAAQGVEAQSVANCYTAIEQGLEVVPVLNKIDLPAADPDRVIDEIEQIIGIEAQDALRISAKTGAGISDLLETLVQRIPAPRGQPEAPLQALIIDSWFDNFVGVISLIRVMNGSIRPKDKIRVMSTGRVYQVEKVGVFSPKREDRPQLDTGKVGYVIAGIKEIDAAPVGDTLTQAHRGASEALPGFQQVQPKVFAGLYPVISDDYEAFREALKKLRLNDAALHFEPETSQALGFGFRCGFLGMLHMEIVQERLEREYDLNLITTAPTVVYEVLTKTGDILHLENPADLPDSGSIEEVREPIIDATILVPQDYLGAVINLCIQKRGVQKQLQYLADQIQLSYELPMNEVVLDFFDRLKSVSRGYASFEYEFKRFQAADLVKLDILINGERVDALSIIVHKEQCQQRGRELTDRMKGVIPRQMFEVAIQAAIGNQVIARCTVKALRKNVTAKCYGGDVTRKRKLLEKQKAGKKRMKQVGNVEIPQEAFLAVLQVGKDGS